MIFIRKEVQDMNKQSVLDAISGKASEKIPFALFTWGFGYMWKILGIEPWQLACGSSKTWHDAHIRLLEAHDPDAIFYSGAGEGDNDPVLLDERKDEWIVKDGNTGKIYEINRISLSMEEAGKSKEEKTVEIDSVKDADRLIPRFEGWGDRYLEGLARLISEAGDRALVLPHHSPGYIRACYALGFEGAMLMMVEKPDLFKYICSIYEDGYDLRMKQLADAGAQAFFIADGWASCDIISPSMFDEFALPCQISMTRAAQKFGLKVILWNEGDILPILKQEKSVGADAFAFEQPRKGADITVDKVRKVFGSERCLFGNLDSEMLLLGNDREEIFNSIKEQIIGSGKGAPFVMCTGSPIPDNVDPGTINHIIEVVRSGGIKI